MPVRSLAPSLLRWPEAEQVLTQVREWAERVAAEHPGLARVGVFGSDGQQGSCADLPSSMLRLLLRSSFNQPEIP